MSESASAHFDQALLEWGGPGTYMLELDEPLPDAELTWWRLHPSEVEVFGLEPMIYPRLLEAYCWYTGALATIAHNDYHDFAEAEQRRWPQFVARAADGSPMFDRELCLGFMHEACALPLRQCAALIAKIEACELRGPTVWFRDELA